MTLKVYALLGSGDNSEGMAIVAANSRDEAMRVGAGIPIEPPYYVRYGVALHAEPLPCTADGEPRLLVRHDYGCEE